MSKERRDKRRDTHTGQFITTPTGRLQGERMVLRSAKGETLYAYRDSATGRYATRKSAERIEITSKRAADSLKRLARR